MSHEHEQRTLREIAAWMLYVGAAALFLPVVVVPEFAARVITGGNVWKGALLLVGPALLVAAISVVHDRVGRRR